MSSSFLWLGLYSVCSFSSFSTERIVSLPRANGYGMVFEQGPCSQWLVVPPIPAWSLLEVAMTSLFFGGLVMQSLTSSFKVIKS